ncbi:MAG TPA: ATP-binding protein [Solirubrobacteraceae bacterium]|nr:ATP-binding protein [Solirubrobacteraceae bacterium]
MSPRRVANVAGAATPATHPAERNPFTPGAGYPPPFLAGRTDTLSAFERHLQSARRVPKHFVITGLRGTGKTVLLREFQRLLTDHGWLWAARELDESANDTRVLMQAVSTDLLKIGTSASLALRLRETGRRVVDTLKPRDIEAWGVRYEPAYANDRNEPARDVLKRSLIDLVQLVRQSHAGVALVYDEFHEIWDGRKPRQTPLATFFGAIKEVQVQSGGVIVVASGLPSLVPNIVRSRSYLERDLNVSRIDHLAAADARAAITVPLSRSAITFTNDLVDRIVEETRGYPYFIQAYSSFLIDSVPWRTRLDLRVFREIRPLLLVDLDESFFGPRFQKLAHTERELLLAVARVGESARYSQLRWSGKRDLLRATVARLVERGHLYRRSAQAEVAFTLPLYRDFLMRIAGEA